MITQTHQEEKKESSQQIFTTEAMQCRTRGSIEAECLVHMAGHRIPFEGVLFTDGRIHRFSADAKKRKKDEWYIASSWVFRGRDYLTVSYGSWSDPDAKYRYESWGETEQDSLSRDERRELGQYLKEMERQAEEERKKRYAEAADEANEIWKNAVKEPISKEHKAYLELKKIECCNIRFGKNPNGYDSIIIPLWNIDGKIRSLQFISVGQSDGTVYKTFLSGGEKKGCFFVIGDLRKTDSFFVAEGFATGASVHKADNSPVVIALDCTNLEFVIATLRTKYQNQQIIIAGDNDVGTEGNPGRSKAEAAAQKHGCRVAFPKFPENLRLSDGKRPTDFNDVQTLLGIDELRRQLRDTKVVTSNQDTDGKQAELAIKIAESILRKQHPTERFSPCALPPSLKTYIEEQSRFSSADPIMMTNALLGTISAFFKTNHYVSGTEYFQTLYPVIWILMILKSGGFKTTSLKAGSELSKRKHTEVMKRLKEKAEEAQKTVGRETSSKRNKEMEETIEKWIDRECADILKEDVLLPHLTTMSGLIQDLSRGRGGVVFLNEFSAWLSHMEKTYNEGLKALFTDLFDVPESIEQKTKTEGTLRIERPFVSICGVSTIDWIKDQIKPSDINSGFFARFLLFLPVPTDEVPSALPKQRDRTALLFAEKEVERILAIAASQQRVYKLSSDARQFFEAIHAEIYKVAKGFSESAQSILEPYLKRWSPYLLKLAMLFQPFFEDEETLLHGTDREIYSQSIVAAISVIEQAIKSTAHLFATELGESDVQRKCRIVLQYIAKHGGKTFRHALLSSHCIPGGKDSYDYVLGTLEQSGQIEIIPSSDGKRKNEHYFLTGTEK